MEG
ncbi:hypothetical protein CTKA_00649 [Chthonomonas calidirosea]|jgi:hypothetical protein